MGMHETLGRRPDPTTWSALEYARHVRECFWFSGTEYCTPLVAETPGFAPMHREERVELAGYAFEDPGNGGRRYRNGVTADRPSLRAVD